TDGIVWSFNAGPRKSVPLNGTFNPHDPNDQRILNYSAIFDEVEDFELNIRNVSGPSPLTAAVLCSAPPPTTSTFDPNHGLLIGDNGDINPPPCTVVAFMKLFAAALSVVFVTTTPSLHLAKGATVKITIECPGRAGPIEITDSAVRQFNIWSGPGTSTFDGDQGFIIDWPNRADAAPVGRHYYKVSFYEGCDPKGSSACHSAAPSLAYVVFYDYDLATAEGFVYLPGRGGEFAQLNTSHIYRGRGYEGHWFRAAKAWNEFVRPIIAMATEHTAAR